ncbi:SapC family protein [Sulfitobacter sp.]|uniref:SapC family protein n=1 Tax=Sulfitobacter sp. TaxID=1903071 RepID=UPI003F6AB3AA
MTKLTLSEHGHLGFRRASSYGFARQIAVQPLAVEEIARAAQVMPVAFRHADDGWQAVAVMGPMHGANVYVSRDGSWRAPYVPGALKLFPFQLAEDGGGLAMWDQCEPELLAKKGVEPFFVDGGLSPVLQRTGNLLAALDRGQKAVRDVLPLLEDAACLSSWQVPGVEGAKDNAKIGGLFRLDRAAFDELHDSVWLKLRHADALGWLHAHLDSLHHAARFKALAEKIVLHSIPAPVQQDPTDKVADFLSVLAQDVS